MYKLGGFMMLMLIMLNGGEHEIEIKDVEVEKIEIVTHKDRVDAHARTLGESYIKEVNSAIDEIEGMEFLDVDLDKYSRLKTPPEEVLVLKDLAEIASFYEASNKCNSILREVENQKEEYRLKQEREREEAERRRQLEKQKALQSQSKHKASNSKSISSESQAAKSKPSGSVSKARSREDWMWDLIWSHPEPIRRGLKGASLVDSLGGNYAGFTYPETMTISIANWIKDSTFRATVSHELGHIYHVRTGLNRTPEWQRIYREEWAGRGHYGSSNDMEAFAETVKAIYAPGSYNAVPQSQIPQSVAYIKKFVDLGH